MKSRLPLAPFLAIVTWLALPSPAVAQDAEVSGTVSTAEGVAISHARVTISANAPGSRPEEFDTASAGEFEFHHVAVGDFTITVEATGYTSAPRHIQVQAKNSVVGVDFKLNRADDAPQATPPTPPPSAAPSFQAAGVRGLIDAGGYSAAANGAAATGLIKGMADIRRADNDPASAAANSFPCSAERELRAGVDRDPKDAGANRRLGEFYLAHGQLERATPYFETARRDNDSDAAAAKDLALAWIKNEKFQDALNLLSRISTQNDPEARTLQARADEGLGLFAQASQEYRAAARLVPSEENFFGIGYELILAGLPTDAGLAFRSGLNHFPVSVQLLIGAGASDFLLGDRAAALDKLLRASEIAPADPRPYRFLVFAQGVSNEKSRVIRDAFGRYLAIVPNDPDANYDYALSLWSTRTQDTSVADLAKIEALFVRAIQLKPEFARAHFQLANLYFERQDYKRAAAEYEFALRGEPNSSEIHYHLARAYQHTGQTDLAAQQMSAFESTRDNNSAQGGAAAVTVEQFISVIAPVQSLPAQNLACNEAAH